MSFISRFSGPIKPFIEGCIKDLLDESFYTLERRSHREIAEFYHGLIRGQNRLKNDEALNFNITADQIARFNAAAEAFKIKLAAKYKEMEAGDINDYTPTGGRRSKRARSKRTRTRSRSKRARSKRR
jgi:hypothetical protein